MNFLDQLNTNPQFPEDVSAHFQQHLTGLGRARLLAVGLRLAPTKDAIKLTDAFLFSNLAGYPMPSLTNETVLRDAKEHAALSVPVENKAYCLAHYQRMPVSKQRDFLAYVNAPAMGVAA